MMIAASGGGAAGGITPSPTHQQHSSSGGLGEQGNHPSPSPSSAYNPAAHAAYLAGHVPVMTLAPGVTVPLTTMDYQAYAAQQSAGSNASAGGSGNNNNNNNNNPSGQPSSGAVPYQQQ